MSWAPPLLGLGFRVEGLGFGKTDLEAMQAMQAQNIRSRLTADSSY